MDLIIVNLKEATSQLAFGVSALILIGGIVVYHVYKSQMRKLYNAEEPDYFLKTEEDNNDTVIVETGNEVVDELKTSSAILEAVEGAFSAENVEVQKLILVRKFVNKSQIVLVQRSPYHASLTIDELVDIYRKLAYKEQLSDGEKSEYNIVGSMLAKKSIYLTKKGYDFADDGYKKE